MKNYFTALLAILLILAVSGDLSAADSRKKYFERPQIGVWYGPITPIFSTGDYLDPNLGGGAFIRYNLPYPPFKLGLETSYQSYDSETVAKMKLIPVYANFLWLLPVNLPIKIQLKAGAGMCKVDMEPDNIKQWDPMFTGGAEISFPAGKLANIALRLDYLCIYEEYMDDAERNGHFFNAGISLYFNLNM